MSRLTDDLNWSITDWSFKMNDNHMDGFYQYEYKKRLINLRNELDEALLRVNDILDKAPTFSLEFNDTEYKVVQRSTEPKVPDDDWKRWA